MELEMKFRPVYWSFVLLSPVVVVLALVYGRRFDANLGGILLQVFGGFVGLSWATWMFLEVGQALTRLCGTVPSAAGAEREEVSPTPRPKPAPTPRRRAA